MNSAEKGDDKFDRQEINNILAIAEEYQNQYEKYLERFRLYRVFQFGIPMIFLILNGLNLITNPKKFQDTNFVFIYLLFSSIIILFSALFIEYFLMRRLKKQIHYLERAIHETVEIVREVIEIKIGSKGSYLEKLEFKLRLSRFGIR